MGTSLSTPPAFPDHCPVMAKNIVISNFHGRIPGYSTFRRRPQDIPLFVGLRHRQNLSGLPIPHSSFRQNNADDLAQTCRSLRTNLEEHHVWLELAEKYCFKNASVARYILSLTTRSTDELRAFVAGQARLDRHWVEKTILTNPPVCFRFQAPTPSLFCELLPGGEYLTLVHRNGDISLLSLADLDNVHQIFKLPASLPTGGVHTVSLTTDYKGCPLLVLSMYGTPRRYLHVLGFCCLTDQP